jgi:hypothetical protein
MIHVFRWQLGFVLPAVQEYLHLESFAFEYLDVLSHLGQLQSLTLADSFLSEPQLPLPYLIPQLSVVRILAQKLGQNSLVSVLAFATGVQRLVVQMMARG